MLASAAASLAAGETGADADLAEGLVPSEAQKDTYDALEATYNSEVFKLEVLTTRHKTFLSELSLWKGTLKEVLKTVKIIHQEQETV